MTLILSLCLPVCNMVIGIQIYDVISVVMRSQHSLYFVNALMPVSAYMILFYEFPFSINTRLASHHYCVNVNL